MAIDDLNPEIMRLFVSDIGAKDFFSYVHNKVTIEKAIAVMGLIYPSFVNIQECIFFLSNSKQEEQLDVPMFGFKNMEDGSLKISHYRRDIERHRNNISITQLFGLWEGEDSIVIRFKSNEEDSSLEYLFANCLCHFWKIRLYDLYPERCFVFEVGRDILDETGTCMTFYQS